MMRKLIVFGLAVVLCAALLPVGSSAASAFPDTRCYRNDAGDVIKCVSVRKIDGVRKFRFRIFEAWWIFKTRVCVGKVEPVKLGRKCRVTGMAQLRKGVWGSTIAWRGVYPFQGPGVYRVIWRDAENGGFLGGPLKFRVR